MVGQKVYIKLLSYPYQEFGAIEGKIGFISSIPTDSGFAVRMTLPRGLTTNSNKNLQFSEGLIGDGEIILADKKLSDKIFEQFNQLGN